MKKAVILAEALPFIQEFSSAGGRRNCSISKPPTRTATTPNAMETAGEGIGKPADVTLIPFYRMHHQRYTVYWQLDEAADKAAPEKSSVEL